MKTLPPPAVLLGAYSQGYFPMPHPKNEEIEWYRPDPRAILPLEGFHISRSFKRVLRNHSFQLTLNQSFEAVMEACSQRETTWINAEFKRAYKALYFSQHAHSIEVWLSSKLVGGIYGVQVGGAFFAESMFSLESEASKIALYYLTKALSKSGFTLLEVQFLTPHLQSLGAIEISDALYQQQLDQAILLSPTLSF